ncbi:MAG TPA: hypothetical protein VGQ12_08605 [Candidatus Angelobacter sp.]|jgi:hypothetical protein|nr:hypothetical protein [Candidatus Angelobacter sp.]
MPWWVTALENLIGGALGGMAIVFGLSKWLASMWLEKQKARYSKELEEFKDGLQREQKRIQAGIDRHVWVTRAQFDTEFNAMKEVFKGLAELMLAINAVRPMFSTSPKGEDKAEKIKRMFERLGAAMTAYDQVIGVPAALSPFFPEDLYLAIQDCLQKANIEILSVQTSNEHEVFETEWFQEGERNRRDFMIAYQTVSRLIRKRIETLAVLPNA